MGSFDTAVATLLVALPTAAAPLHDALPVVPPLHGAVGTVFGPDHFVVDAAIGIAVGVALVGLYLAVLRWVRGGTESDSPAGGARNGQRQDS